MFGMLGSGLPSWLQFGSSNQGICPYCGLNLFAQHPLYNVAPHLMGQCASLPVHKADFTQDDVETLKKMGIAG